MFIIVPLIFSTFQLFNFSTFQLFNFSTFQLFNFSTFQLALKTLTRRTGQKFQEGLTVPQTFTQSDVLLETV